MSARLRFVLLSVVLLGAASFAGAQQRPEPGDPGAQAGAAAPGAGEPAGHLTLSFRGLASGDILRIGQTGLQPQDQIVAPETPTEVEVEYGKSYDIAWGDSERPSRARFYVPRPADPLMVPVPVEVTLRRGGRSVAEQVFKAYPWAAGENQKVAAALPSSGGEAGARTGRQNDAAARAPAAPVPVPVGISQLEQRVAALEAAAAASQHGGQLTTYPAELLSAIGIGLGCLALAAIVGFAAGVWRPYREAISQALERTLPDALRERSQESARLAQRLDAVHAQWEHDRDALRRGQELLAAHGSGDAIAALRGELDALRSDLDQLRGGSPGAGPGQPAR